MNLSSYCLELNRTKLIENSLPSRSEEYKNKKPPSLEVPHILIRILRAYFWNMFQDLINQLVLNILRYCDPCTTVRGIEASLFQSNKFFFLTVINQNILLPFFSIKSNHLSIFSCNTGGSLFCDCNSKIFVHYFV